MKVLVFGHPAITMLSRVLRGPLPKMFMENTVLGIDREI